LRPLRALSPFATTTTFRVAFIRPASLRSPEIANGFGIGVAVTDIRSSPHARDYVAVHAIQLDVVPRLRGAEASLLIILIR
jgi:hypothetical protein